MGFQSSQTNFHFIEVAVVGISLNQDYYTFKSFKICADTKHIAGRILLT